MNLGQAGLDLIKSFESLKLSPYDDGYGYLTIGWGHKIKPGEHFGTITREQADQLLVQDTAIAVNAVNNLVKVPLTQNQFDALVSLQFNWGALGQSLLLQYLNAGDYAKAAQRLGEWPVTSRGQFSRGLQRRRLAEKALFLSDNSTQDIASADLAAGEPVLDDNGGLIDASAYLSNEDDSYFGASAFTTAAVIALVGVFAFVYLRD